MIVKRALILEEKRNPSTDYFVLPYLISILPPETPIKRLSWHEVLQPTDLEGALVVLVRYVTNPWRNIITNHRQYVNQLVYFIDDDLADAQATNGLPWRYRIKLWLYARRHWNWLMSTKTQFWVSTDFLKNKYAQFQPLTIEPQQIVSLGKRCRVFYHATASHRAEIEWLLPVMKAVLKQAPFIDFEIIGDRHTLRDYKHLPRTTVVHPMSWQSYQSFVSLTGRDLGLAPFLPSAFNAARSHTKMFDMMRAHAHGLFAENGPWVQPINELKLSQTYDREFKLLPMKQGLWVQKIVEWGQEIVSHKNITKV
jgi:hypothetical protein